MQEFYASRCFIVYSTKFVPGNLSLRDPCEKHSHAQFLPVDDKKPLEASVTILIV